jgi:hypothetical protein
MTIIEAIVESTPKEFAIGVQRLSECPLPARPQSGVSVRFLCCFRRAAPFRDSKRIRIERRFRCHLGTDSPRRRRD